MTSKGRKQNERRQKLLDPKKAGPEVRYAIEAQSGDLGRPFVDLHFVSGRGSAYLWIGNAEDGCFGIIEGAQLRGLAEMIALEMDAAAARGKGAKQNRISAQDAAAEEAAAKYAAECEARLAERKA